MNNKIVSLVSFNWEKSQHKEVNRALEMVSYLKDQGLVNNLDFTWSLDPELKCTTFNFYNDKDMYGSYLTLKYS